MGSSSEAVVRPAQASDIDRVARLFDAYRQFYQQAPDLAGAIAFVRNRFERNESMILVADVATSLSGFAQLYPTFCSVAAAPIFILYDLFVDLQARRRGVGRALLRAACEHARGQGAVRLDLATARSNIAAQRLYESEGWMRDEQFYRYAFAV